MKMLQCFRFLKRRIKSDFNQALPSLIFKFVPVWITLLKKKITKVLENKKVLAKNDDKLLNMPCTPTNYKCKKDGWQ